MPGPVCVCVCMMLWVFTFNFFETGSFTEQWAPEPSFLHLPSIGVTGLQVTPSFNMDTGDLKSVPHACSASPLPTEPSSPPCMGILKAVPNDPIIWIPIVCFPLMYKLPCKHSMVWLSAPRMVLVRYSRPCPGVYYRSLEACPWKEFLCLFLVLYFLGNEVSTLQYCYPVYSQNPKQWVHFGVEAPKLWPN